MRKRVFLAAALALAGAALFGDGLYLYAKARLAQVLLARAWTRTLRGARDAKPWRWADTWPVARLELPRQHASAIVLAGASGRTMAFGPGHVDGTAMPGERGNCAISAHRDTQFAVLRDLRPGDPIVVERSDGRRVAFVADAARVVDRRDLSVLEPTAEPTLTLITCYPFDAVVPGGPLRYVVVAHLAQQQVDGKGGIDAKSNQHAQSGSHQGAAAAAGAHRDGRPRGQGARAAGARDRARAEDARADRGRVVLSDFQEDR